MENPPLNIDDLIREYRSGRSMEDVAREAGISRKVLRRLFTERGVERLPKEAFYRNIPESKRREMLASARAARDLGLDMGYIAGQYSQGRSTVDIARELGISDTTISRRLQQHGVTLRSPSERRQLAPSPARRPDVDTDDVVLAYLAGESENSIAKRYNIARNAIRTRLLQAGVAPRGPSESERAKWARMLPSQRDAQVEAAHAATRGRPNSLSSKIRRAQTVERRQLHVSEYERQMAGWLSRHGIPVVHQKAIGPYNCDLGAYPVAVEIFGGGWHWSGRHMLRTPERFRYILDAGWHILAVKAERGDFSTATGDHVASYIQRASSYPSAPREYWVIGSDGELLAAGSADDDEISIIPAFTRGRDFRGRYTRVPR